jgi:hypothetical protein
MRANDSRRNTGRHRANRAERNRQPSGYPKGDGPVRRAPRQRGGLNRLGLVAAKRLPTSTKDAPLIPDLEAQSRGVEDGESGVQAGCPQRFRMSFPHAACTKGSSADLGFDGSRPIKHVHSSKSARHAEVLLDQTTGPRRGYGIAGGGADGLILQNLRHCTICGNRGLPKIAVCPRRRAAHRKKQRQQYAKQSRHTLRSWDGGS